MADTIHIVGLIGSLRKGSFNKALMRHAESVVPAGAKIEVLEIGDLPLYNTDLEHSLPEVVKTLKEKVKSADAVLIATPEYNYSIPGALKNALDWISRPYGDNSADGLPVAVMGASVGMAGTARSQSHIRQVFQYLNMHALNTPEVLVPAAKDKFDENGNIMDAHTKEKVQELVVALVEWTRKLGSQ